MGELGINLPQLIAQIINFGLLFILLYFVAYKPLLKMFDTRSKKIKDSMDQTEYIKQQAAQAEENVKKQMETARRESQDIIARTMRTADELRQKAQQDARLEGENLVNRARVEIQREREDAVAEIRQEFGDLTITAAEKVIGKSLDKEAHRKLIDSVLEQSTKGQG